MNATRSLLFILCSLSAGMANGQNDEPSTVPAQFSFIYPLGTSGLRSAGHVYHFSLNALTGVTGGIQGCEIGGLVNLNKGDVSGFQVGGTGNVTNGNVEGVQVGGIFSLAEDFNGVQLSGIMSRAGEAGGIQVSGIVNMSRSSNVSIAGIANLNQGNTRGMQLGGVYNQTGELKGMQIGLVNVADTISKGISVGLVIIVKKGFYDEWTVSAADYLNIGVSYKVGTKVFYNICTLGYSFLEEQLWVAGFGFGGIKEVNAKFSFQPELVCYTYFPVNFERPIRDTYITHFKFGLVRNLSEKIAVSFAPSVYWSLKSNRGVSETYGYEQSPVKLYRSVDPSFSNSRLSFGLGFGVGIIFK